MVGYKLGALLDGFLEFHLRRVQQAHQRIAEQVRIVALVEAPLKLIEVRLKMLPAELVIGTSFIV